MAELARTHKTNQTLALPVREHLRTLDDGEVVSAFLAGEESTAGIQHTVFGLFADRECLPIVGMARRQDVLR